MVQTCTHLKMFKVSKLLALAIVNAKETEMSPPTWEFTHLMVYSKSSMAQMFSILCHRKLCNITAT